MLVSLGIYFVGSVTLLLAIFAIIGSDDSLRGPWLLIGVAGPHALLVTHLLRVSRSKGHGLAADFQFRVCRSDIRMGIGLFFAALFGAGLVTKLVGEAPTATAIEVAQDSADDGLTVWLYLFAILGATFIPVVEELVYRGLFGALSKNGACTRGPF